MEGTKKLRHNKGSNNNNNNNNNNSSSSRNGSNSKNGSNNMRINPPEPEPAADSSPGEDPAWQQNRRPQRIKRSDNLQQKRMASKKGSAPLPAQDFQDQPQFPERFSQRRGKGKHVPWVSEKDQMDRLGLQVLGGRRGDGGDGMEQIRVEKNPLVARYEYESTRHFTEAWRKIPEIPTPQELLQTDVDVPTNMIDGPFESVSDYLGTHYELVREDTLSGLRAAILYVKNHPESDDTREIAIYEDVKLIGWTFAPNHGVCAKVTFSLNRAGKYIRWEQSKRLIPGTLVCLSQDNFETFKVATVAARPLAGLALTPPELDIIFDVEKFEIDASKPFLMVESRQGYFEAFKWVLKAMQRMTENNMPLQDHLVMMDKDVGPPKYLEENPVYNLSSIFPDAQDKEVVEEVNILEQWPRKVKSSMDKSQTDALKAILTKRIAVIQGPPGTGKTYTSVMALHALLQNMTEDDPPVIVACQTNHALDQLLRHVYKFEHEIIRLGGRTQDRDEIKKRTIFEVRKGSKARIVGRSSFGIRKDMEGIQHKMCRILSPLVSDLIAPESLFELKLINKTQMESFAKGSNDWVRAQGDNPNSPISTWLHESLVPVDKQETIYRQEEEADIDYEALKDLEAEFLGTNNEDEEFKDDLRGYYYGIKHNFQVYCPDGISEEEIQRSLRNQNMWKLPDHMRAAVYVYWEKEATRRIHEQLKPLNREYQKLVTDNKIAKMEKDSYLISQCKLVGMTTTGLSKYRSLIASCLPKVILIEEAAECLEAPVLVGCLPSIQHMILVGDHKQLKGKCNVSELQGPPYNLDVSMFERWVNNEMPFVALRTQRRMRPEIRELLEPIYPNQLRDHESVLGRDPVQGMGGINTFWHCHNAYEETMEDTPSKINRFEAEMISKFVEYLVLNGVESKKITILTFYTGQRQLIQRTLYKNPNFGATYFQVATVDSYQGEENDIIILSLVRSNFDNNIGFLDNENRVCVALSRAQRGFYIFGNGVMVTGANQLWWDVGNILNKSRNPARIGYSLPLTCHRHKERTLIEDVSSWDDLAGGCKTICKERLACGHECPLRCHPFAHEKYRCLEPCKKTLPCGHPCTKSCWEVCACPKDCLDPLLMIPKEEKKEALVEEAMDKEVEETLGDLGFGGIPRPVGPSKRGFGRNGGEGRR